MDRLGSGRVVAWEVRESGAGITAVLADELDDAERAEVAAKLAWMLGLEQDLRPFYAAAAGEPKLAHVPAGAYGRILRSPTLFEDTVKTILTTNTAWSGTKRMNQALVDLYGEPLTADPARRAFPTPARLAEVPAEELRAAGLGYRAPYINELARRVAEGELDLEGLKTADLAHPRPAQGTAGDQGRGRLCGSQSTAAAGPGGLHPHGFVRARHGLARIPRRRAGGRKGN